MATSQQPVKRRDFLGALAASGLVIAIGARGVRRLEAASTALAADGDWMPSVYLRIADDGAVTAVVHRSEMGQGIRSTLASIIADELGVDARSVTIEQALGDKKYGDQNTDGSTSIRMGSLQKFREAGAVARTLLERAAADSWGVDAASVRTENGRVLHGATGRSLAFGALVAKARAITPPKTVTLKDASQFKYIGKPMPGLDLPAMLTGKATYGQDLRVPGMKIAVLAHAPVYGAKVKSVDSAAALKVAGVEKVLVVPGTPIPSGMQSTGGVAVIATSTWAAIKGREALKVTWDLGPNAVYDSAKYRAELTANVRKEGTVVRDQGNAPEALSKAKKVISAEYYAPHHAHAPMEPPAALAIAKDGACETWACVQDPQSVQNEVAKVLGIKPEKVTSHVTLLGGAFGRKSKPDFVCEAAWLSRELGGTPVKVVWTREDDLGNGFPHTVAMQRLEASLDDGKVHAWRHRIASPPIGSTFAPGQDRQGPGDLAQGILDLPYAFPHIRGESCAAPPHVRIGWFRSVTAIPLAFAVGSFMDELAHAAGKDPLAFLLESLGPARIADVKQWGGKADFDNYGHPWAEHPMDIGRHRRVLEKAAEAAGWGRKLGPNEGMGIASHLSFATYVAAVVHVHVAPTELHIPRVDVAMDCGLAVNPDRVRSQVEGAVVMGLTNALTAELSYQGGRAVQQNLNQYKVLRMAQAPREIRVHLVHDGGPIGGVGEPAVPPIAPALANAIYAATKRRIRSLPILPQLFKKG